MFCGRCNNELEDCLCPDIDERMAKLGAKDGPLVFKACKTCKKHYARCRCKNPEWTTSDKL